MTNRRSQGVDLKDIFWRALPILGFAAGATVGLLYGKTGLANELLGCAWKQHVACITDKNVLREIFSAPRTARCTHAA